MASCRDEIESSKKRLLGRPSKREGNMGSKTEICEGRVDRTWGCLQEGPEENP